MIKQQIIQFLFDSWTRPEQGGFLFHPSFLLKKTIDLDFEGDARVSNPVWSASGKMTDGSLIKILIGKVSEPGAEEFILLFQMGDLSTYLLEILPDNIEENRGVFWYGDRWVEMGMSILSKFLVGIVQLKDLHIQYEAAANADLYQSLVEYLNALGG